MKINVGNRNEDENHENKDENKELEYLYRSYKPLQTTSYYQREKGISFKWLFQLLISGAILILIAGLFRLDIPYSGALKNGVSYLLTSETDVKPIFYNVVRLASQIGNLEWPVMDDTLGPVQPAIQEEVNESVFPLPVSGNVIKGYGWVENQEENVKTFHEGIDIAVPAGTPVEASTAGTVIKTGETTDSGKYVLVQIGSGYLFRYANLGTTSVKEKQKVEMGEILGKTGTAEKGEAHLHFEVIVDGQPVDPLEKMGVNPASAADEMKPEKK